MPAPHEPPTTNHEPPTTSPITISTPDGTTSATFVPELGGICSSLVLPGPEGPREVLFQHEHFWEKKTRETRGGVPLLFPFCGRVAVGERQETYEWEGESFYMPIHGFASRMPWELVKSGRADELIMELYDTDTTRSRYPFSFRIGLRCRVTPGACTWRLSVKNQSHRPMPYYAGFHPYFAIASGGVSLEWAPVRCWRYNEIYTALAGEEPDPPPRIDPHEAYWRGVITECEPGRPLVLSYSDGFTLHLQSESETPALAFPYTQLHTELGKPYVCIEPWMVPPGILTSGRVHTLAPSAREDTTFTIKAH